MSRSLYLVRHGEPSDLTIFYGQLDVGLSPRGFEQVERQARALRSVPLSAILSSDLTRARFGADAISRGRDIAVEYVEALREMRLGCLEGVTHGVARTSYPELASRPYLDMLDFRMPGGGESVRDVAARVVPCAETVIGRHLAGPGSNSVLIYAHNTVVRVLLSMARWGHPEGYVDFPHGYGTIGRVDFGDPVGGSAWTSARIAFFGREPDALRAS